MSGTMVGVYGGKVPFFNHHYLILPPSKKEKKEGAKTKEVYLFRNRLS